MGLHCLNMSDQGLYCLHITNKKDGLNLEVYSKTCLKRPLKKKTKLCFHDQLSLNAGQKYCRMLQGEHSAILSTFIKPQSVMQIFVVFFLFLSGRFRQVLLYFTFRTCIVGIRNGCIIAQSSLVTGAISYFPKSNGEVESITYGVTFHPVVRTVAGTMNSDRDNHQNERHLREA